MNGDFFFKLYVGLAVIALWFGAMGLHRIADAIRELVISDEDDDG